MSVLPPLKLILASASPRRTELLAAAGVPHQVVVAQVTEHEDSATDPREMVLHNAHLKARAVAEKFIRPNDRLTSFERLQIYNQQYWLPPQNNFQTGLQKIQVR